MSTDIQKQEEKLKQTLDRIGKWRKIIDEGDVFRKVKYSLTKSQSLIQKIADVIKVCLNNMEP